MDYQEFIHPELLVLIPVLYLTGFAIKKSRIKDTSIPLILGITGIVLSAAWVFSSGEIHTVSEILGALFTALTQGIMTAGAAVYSNQLYVQAKKRNEEVSTKEKHNSRKGNNDDGNV